MSPSSSCFSSSTSPSSPPSTSSTSAPSSSTTTTSSSSSSSPATTGYAASGFAIDICGLSLQAGNQSPRGFRIVGFRCLLWYCVQGAVAKLTASSRRCHCVEHLNIIACIDPAWPRQQQPFYSTCRFTSLALRPVMGKLSDIDKLSHHSCARDPGMDGSHGKIRLTNENSMSMLSLPLLFLVPAQ